MDKSYQVARNTRDALDGCINCMFVSEDEKEIDKMYKYAKLYLEQIHSYGLYRLKGGMLCMTLMVTLNL